MAPNGAFLLFNYFILYEKTSYTIGTISIIEGEISDSKATHPYTETRVSVVNSKFGKMLIYEHNYTEKTLDFRIEKLNY